MVQHTQITGDESHRYICNLYLNAVMDISMDRKRTTIKMDKLFHSINNSMDPIIDVYLSTRSNEITNNMFLLISEYLIDKLVSSSPHDQQENIKHQSTLLHSFLVSQTAHETF